MVTDAELLLQYLEQKADAAFAEFVRRHVDLVYGSAVRRVGGDVHLAEDVTQQVFTAAAREAAVLARHPAIVGWLFATTRNRAVQVVRSERRRHRREQEAFAMSPNVPETGLDWEKLRPFVDNLVDGLNDPDRQVVLLRFFENRSYAEIAAAMHVAENAARMRVDRALDRMSAALRRKGVTSTSVALATVLLADAVIAAPVGVAATATSVALTAGATGTATSWLAFMGIAKIHIVVTAAALAAATTGWVVEHQAAERDRAALASLRADLDSGAVLTAENARLRKQQADADDAARAAAATIAELYRKTDVARQQLAAWQREAAKSRQATTRKAHYRGPVYDVSALDAPPQPTLRLPPQYPMELRRQGVTGSATIEFVVGSEGRVTDVHAVSATHPEFADAAVAAVERWQFAAGKLQGVAVGSRVQIPIKFTLQNAPPGGTGSPSSSSPEANHFAPTNWF